MRAETTTSVTMLGAVVSAVAASACCIGPLIFALLGLGGAGFLVAMEPYRPLFTGLTVALLGAGFFLSYRRPAAATDDCGCEQPRSARAGRWLLWGATGIAAVALFFPSLIPLLI